ncbi:hypothetical protein [Streptomyces fumanus]|uniref:Uncharacterized protein n=1 Tax=Streptomyces fumanus TaxID=67302 RepID=A0A919E2F8_9ACTN|nr:hypothetical protein [Streptomyces fumanus]GHF04181.1 hypothetical protein GCM10018772_31550 [Streptomyces fumanus]
MPSDPAHSRDTQPTMRLAEAEPGVPSHPYVDRCLTVADWLLSAHPSPRDARAEWAEHGIAVLALGTLFSALRIPGRVVQAVAASTDPADIDAVLDETLGGGPVICDIHGPRYYALVPANVPRTWRDAVDDWRKDDVECLGHGTYLGVPRLDTVEFPVRGTASYWSVPLTTPARLCRPLAVARLIAAGAQDPAEERWTPRGDGVTRQG